MTDIQKRLFELQDIKYRDFQSALIPNIEKSTFIGVRTPEIKRFAKELKGSGEEIRFLFSLPHKYFDENQLHAFLIMLDKDFDKALQSVIDFLPYINNWATCDQLSPKCFYRSPEKLLPYIEEWISSDRPYTVRFGIGALMRYFLDERFDIKYASAVASIKSDEYYVKMMVAWYFATALAKQFDSVLTMIEETKLDIWTHNKAIQKAIESHRISDESKAVLRNLRIR